MAEDAENRKKHFSWEDNDFIIIPAKKDNKNTEEDPEQVDNQNA